MKQAVQQVLSRRMGVLDILVHEIGTKLDLDPTTP